MHRCTFSDPERTRPLWLTIVHAVEEAYEALSDVVTWRHRLQNPSGLRDHTAELLFEL